MILKLCADAYYDVTFFPEIINFPECLTRVAETTRKVVKFVKVHLKWIVPKDYIIL